MFARPRAKHFTSIISLNPHNNPMELVLLSPFYRWRRQGLERWHNLPVDTRWHKISRWQNWDLIPVWIPELSLGPGVSWPPFIHVRNTCLGTSLVAQWLRIHLPMQGTRVQALVREDLTCHRATKPVHHNYWAWALEPASHNYWARVPQLLKPARLEPVLHNKRNHRNEKPPQWEARALQWRVTPVCRN